MMALGWVKTQLFNVFTPSYAAHLNAQRKQVAENAAKIQALQKTQDKYRQFFVKLRAVDADLSNSLTELVQSAQQVEKAKQGVVAVIVEEDQILEKAWPQVKQEMELLLRWIKFNEPGGVLGEVEKFLEEHRRSLAQELELAKVQAQVNRLAQEAARLKDLQQKVTVVADDLHNTAVKVAAIAAKKPGGAAPSLKSSPELAMTV